MVVVSALNMVIRRGLILCLGGIFILIIVHIAIVVLALIVVVYGELAIKVVDVAEVSRSSQRSRPSRGTRGTDTRLELMYRSVLLPEAAREVDANIPPNPWLLAGPRAASLVVVLNLAERPSLPHGVSRVDTAGSSNGLVEKMGVASEPRLQCPSISCCDAAHQRTRRKAGRVINAAQKSCNAPPVSYTALKTKHMCRCQVATGLHLHGRPTLVGEESQVWTPP
jgi:hypothetical protein